jgi:hypothetical protein
MPINVEQESGDDGAGAADPDAGRQLYGYIEGLSDPSISFTWSADDSDYYTIVGPTATLPAGMYSVQLLASLIAGGSGFTGRFINSGVVEPFSGLMPTGYIKLAASGIDTLSVCSTHVKNTSADITFGLEVDAGGASSPFGIRVLITRLGPAPA